MNKVITISREFGSGGREIGKRLADELGFTYYDREIVEELAVATGLSERYIQDISEKGIYPHSFQFGKTFSTFGVLQSNQTEVFVKQQEIVKKIAEKGDCVIVGRGANVILKDYKSMNIFVYADMKSKVNRCKIKATNCEEIQEKELEKKIRQVDKNRKNYHSLISNLEWGKKENYDLCINTSNIEIKDVILSLADYIREYFRRTEVEK
ncbi:MAG: cytidylate kinase-like family protein [Clostridia bacterium]|nr:cytidylate kinase-like family protein [Clostridia bacterium]